MMAVILNIDDDILIGEPVNGALETRWVAGSTWLHFTSLGSQVVRLASLDLQVLN